VKNIDVSTKKFPNTFAVVSDEDFDELARYHWIAVQDCHVVYARLAYRMDGVLKHITMHRQIMGRLEDIDGKLIDHVDGNGLNNTRENMRSCTVRQNTCNSRKRSKNMSSVFKGVTWDSWTDRWMARIKIEEGTNRGYRNLGRFSSEKEAALAYDAVALQVFGQFACVNFGR
jgi:hypothetical protein